MKRRYSFLVQNVKATLVRELVYAGKKDNTYDFIHRYTYLQMFKLLNVTMTYVKKYISSFIYLKCHLDLSDQDVSVNSEIWKEKISNLFITSSLLFRAIFSHGSFLQCVLKTLLGGSSVVCFGFSPLNFGKVVGTDECNLPFCECRWDGDLEIIERHQGLKGSITDSVKQWEMMP